VESPLAAFEDALRHEQLVTGWINDLADLAFNEKDHATSSMLQWFIDEQVEEEATTSEIVERLKLIGDSKGALFFLDNELKQRKSAPKQPASKILYIKKEADKTISLLFVFYYILVDKFSDFMDDVFNLFFCEFR
jgi:hypothetical protein